MSNALRYYLRHTLQSSAHFSVYLAGHFFTKYTNSIPHYESGMWFEKMGQLLLDQLKCERTLSSAIEV